MVSQDLVAAIDSSLSQGQSPQEVKEFFLSEGWSESAIDSVFEERLKKKEPSPWERMPLYQAFLRLDKKSAALPRRVVFGICMGLVFFVLVASFILYKIADPFNLNGVSRDAERDSVYAQLQAGLKRYYDDKKRYPNSLSELVPDYIEYVPRDPKSNKPYGYRLVGTNDYRFCIYFETKPPSPDCINTEFY
jgi:hypothetical protein